MVAILDIWLMTWRDFWKRTSIAGASNAGSSKSSLRKLCWIVLFLAGLALTILAALQVINAYLSYPINTTTALQRYTKIPFPGVTICNQNRIDCQKLLELYKVCNTNPDSCAFMSGSVEVLTRIMNGACKHDSPTRKKRALNTKNYHNSQHQLDFEPPNLRETGEMSKEATEEYNFLRNYMSLPQEERILIGHSFENFIKSCTFRERDCHNSSYFYVTNHPSFGNCYTFNSVINLDDEFGGKRVTSMSGPTFGISIALNIEQNKYMVDGKTKMAGARLIIHGPDHFPLPDEDGFDLTPNTMTRIAIQERNISRLADPYPSSCSSDWSSTNYTNYVPTIQNETPWNYSLALCNRVCLSSSFAEECQCFHPLYASKDQNTGGLYPCDIAGNVNDSLCVDKIIDQLDQGERNCNCSVDCQETSYTKTISESVWPSNQYTQDAMEEYQLDGESQLVSNLLQTQIYFTTLNVQEIVESAVYSLKDSSLISAFGGALSLYLGISLIMVFEVVEFMIDLGINTYQYCVKGKRPEKFRKDKKGNDVLQISNANSFRSVTPTDLSPKPYRRTRF